MRWPTDRLPHKMLAVIPKGRNWPPQTKLGKPKQEAVRELGLQWMQASVSWVAQDRNAWWRLVEANGYPTRIRQGEQDDDLYEKSPKGASQLVKVWLHDTFILFKRNIKFCCFIYYVGHKVLSNLLMLLQVFGKELLCLTWLSYAAWVTYVIVPEIHIKLIEVQLNNLLLFVKSEGFINLP